MNTHVNTRNHDGSLVYLYIEWRPRAIQPAKQKQFP